MISKREGEKAKKRKRKDGNKKKKIMRMKLAATKNAF